MSKISESKRRELAEGRLKRRALKKLNNFKYRKSPYNRPRILYFDIETSPCLAYVWGCGKQFVGIKQLKKERKIISIGYMFEDDSKVKVLKMDITKHKIHRFDDNADKKMLIQFVKIYNSAHLVVAHNGRRFDRARIRARLVKYGLPDLDTSIPFDDSYTMTKEIDFTSHKLDHLGRYLETGQKDQIDYSVWTKIMEGCKSALTEMCNYMKTDVIRLRAAYRRLKPYAKSKLNLSAFHNQAEMCPCCGSHSFRKDCIRYTNGGQYQSYKCKDCGKRFQDGRNLIVKSSKIKR